MSSSKKKEKEKKLEREARQLGVAKHLAITPSKLRIQSPSRCRVDRLMDGRY